MRMKSPRTILRLILVAGVWIAIVAFVVSRDPRAADPRIIYGENFRP